MPPKSHNVQLAAARKSKQLKKIQNTKVNLLSLLETDDDLSDNFEEDGIWVDIDLEETIDKIEPSVFDIMHQNSKDPAVFNNSRPFTYHGILKEPKGEKKQLQKRQV